MDCGTFHIRKLLKLAVFNQVGVNSNHIHMYAVDIRGCLRRWGGEV